MGHNAPTRKRRNHRREAIERVRAGLDRVCHGSEGAVVIEALDTPYYCQAHLDGSRLRGEAVGEVHLPRLHVYHGGDRMRTELAALGWLAPTDQAIDFGNWVQSWSIDDIAEAADIIVRTFARAFGLNPGALVVTVVPLRSPDRAPLG